MLWLIRLQRFWYAICASIIVTGIGLKFAQYNGYFKGVSPAGCAFFVFIFAMVWSFIEFKIKIPNPKSINTNRHVFKAIREITEIIPNALKPHIAMLFLPLVNMRKGTDYGLGGSSKFASAFDHWQHKYDQDRGDIFLGCSVWDQNCSVGQFDDKGGITFSEPRNGKGTSFIIPNLKLYQGSVLVLDGKNGENIDATGRDRANNKGRVLCVDPYSKSEYGKKNGTVRFNPLAELDPDSDTIVDDLAILSDALVIKSGHAKEDHFADGGERLIKALIGHMISSHDNPNLADLRDLIMRMMAGDKALLDEMTANMACHGIIQQAAVLFSENTTEIRNFISSAVKATEWLTKPIIREVLSASDFSFQDLKKHSGTSIYLVLDADTITINAPFLRLFVNIAVRSLRKGDKPKIPVLFLLDEFYSLGRMDQLSKNIDEIPGYGVKLWPVMHRIGQLKELYEENWDSFLGGTQVYFGLNQKTAEFVETQIGHRGFEREGVRDDVIYTGLLSAKEIRDITSNAKEAGNQIVLRADGSPLLLRRVPYYTSQFKKIKIKQTRQLTEDDLIISDRIQKNIEFSVSGLGVEFESPSFSQRIFKHNNDSGILDEATFYYDGSSISIPSYCDKKAYVWSTNTGKIIKEIDSGNSDGDCYANRYLYKCGEGVIFGNSYNLYICNSNGSVQHISEDSSLYPSDGFINGSCQSNIRVIKNGNTIIFLAGIKVIFLDRDSDCGDFEKTTIINDWKNNSPYHSQRFKVFENIDDSLSYICIYQAESSYSKELSTTLTFLSLISLKERRVVNTCSLKGIQNVCIHPSGNSLIVLGYELTLLSVPDLKTIKSAELPVDRNTTTYCGECVICYSPCGNYLALSYAMNGEVEVRNAQTLDILYVFEGHGLPQSGMSWNATGQYLACGFCRKEGNKDKATLMVWDTKLEKLVLHTKSSYFGYANNNDPVFRWSPSVYASELACIIDRTRIKIYGFERNSLNRNYGETLESAVQKGKVDPLPFTDEEKQYIGYTESYWVYKHYERLLEVIANNNYPGVRRWSEQVAYEREAIKTPERQKRIVISKLNERIALEILLKDEYIDFREIFGISDYHSLNDFETEHGFFVAHRANYFGEIMEELLSAISSIKLEYCLNNDQIPDLIRFLISKSIMQAREENGSSFKKGINSSGLVFSLKNNVYNIRKADLFAYLKVAEEGRQQENPTENEPSSEEAEDNETETDFALKVEAARKRWVLPETFTEEQVKERYPIILDNVGTDEFEQVEKDFKILMQAVSLFEKESRNITMPDGSIILFTADKALWNNMAHLIKHCDYTEERLVEIASINAKEANISFEQSFTEVIDHFYRKHTQ